MARFYLGPISTSFPSKFGELIQGIIKSQNLSMEALYFSDLIELARREIWKKCYSASIQKKLPVLKASVCSKVYGTHQYSCFEKNKKYGKIKGKSQ